MQQPQLAVAIALHLPQGGKFVGVQAETETHGTQHYLGHPGQAMVKGCGVVAEPGQHIVRQPDVGLLVIVLTAYFVALLYRSGESQATRDHKRTANCLP